MKFWQSFSKKAVMRQFFFVLALFVLLIPAAIWDSDTQVKVNFSSDEVYIRSDRYTMTIQYEQIASAELAAMAEPGEVVQNGYDNDIIRTGVWHNDTWGEYYITADLDTSNCIVLTLTDGRTFVFSCKNDKKTAEHFETLQSYLSAAN